MDEPQQGQSGQQQQQQQQQPSGRAEEDAAEEQPAGPTPPAAATTAAAAEDTTPANAAAGQYDPREFQNPHPDDATTATGANTTAGRSKKTAKTKGGKATKKGGGKGDADDKPCSNCGTLGASRKCSQCRQTQYCGEECFKVGACAHTGGRARAVCSAGSPPPHPPSPV